MARRGNLRQSNPPWRKAQRPSDPGADKIPDGDKPQSRKSHRLIGVAGFCIPRRRGDRMRRRDFIALVGGAAAAPVLPPLAARAQQPALPVVGLLQAGSPEPNAQRLVAFRDGLSKAGYADGQNVRIEARWSEDRNDRLPELAAELVRLPVAVIATPLSTAATRAAEAATK